MDKPKLFHKKSNEHIIHNKNKANNNNPTLINNYINATNRMKSYKPVGQTNITYNNINKNENNKKNDNLISHNNKINNKK